MRLRLGAALASIALLTACGGDDAQNTTPKTTASRTNQATVPPATAASEFVLESPTFEEGGSIPEVYTCEGENRLPDLSWSDPPPGTETFVLIMDDPDAPGGSFTHLLLYDILREIRSNPPDVDETADGPYAAGALGLTSDNEVTYTGPCPPRGQTHSYVFTLYALDSRLDREAGANRDEIMALMEGHILAEATLTGTFGR